MFECKSCNYITEVHMNYERHVKSPKHIESSLAYTKINSKQVKCKFCNEIKLFSNINRHSKSCKKRNEYILKQELEFQNYKIQKLTNQINELDKSNYTLTEENKKLKSSIKIMNNAINLLTFEIAKDEPEYEFNISYPKDNTDSTTFYIVQNFTNAMNIEDIGKMHISKSEKANLVPDRNIAHLGIAIAQNYISKRCIDIPINERPFFCINKARNIYLTRHNNKWVRDPKGNLIRKYLLKPILKCVNEILSYLDADLNTLIEIVKDMIAIKRNFHLKSLQKMKNKTLFNANIPELQDNK